MEELDQLPDALELLRVQQRQPAPGYQPAPLNQDALRGYGAPSRPAPRPAPRQPQPAPVDQAQPPQMPTEQPVQQPSQPAQMEELPDALEVLRGSPQTSAPQLARQPAQPGSKLGTWRGDRIREAIVGKTDPNYSNLPRMADVLAKEGDLSYGREAFAFGVGASDKDMAKQYAQMLGDRFQGVEQDANGYPVVVYRDKATGDTKKAYANTPGLDVQDVQRGIYGALPFAKTAQIVSALGKGAPLAGRMLVQGAGQAGTSLAQDATAIGSGVSDFNPVESAVKAGVTALGGAGGELIGEGINFAMRRRLAKQLYDARAAKLTPQGEEAARAAGVDPTDMVGKVAEDFAKEFARTGDAQAAFRATASNEAGIRRSLGEITQNREQLLREQQMRGGTYGTQAREAVTNFDELQKADIERATRGVRPPSEVPTIPQRIAPDRASMLAGGRTTKADAGGNIASNNQAAYATAKQQEKQAWDAVPVMRANEETLAELGPSIRTKFDDVAKSSGRPLIVDEELTPIATRMAKELELFQSGQAPAKASSILPDNTVGDIDTMRRRLLGISNKAADATDRRAAKAIYDGFIDWQVVAAEKSGDLLAAAKARSARETTRQLHEIFDGEKGSAGAGILKNVFKGQDSPEGIVNSLFTGPTAQLKNGSTSAIANLKRAYDTYLEPELAKRAWDDVRLAYWLKMTTDKGTEAKTPGNLATSIKTMLGDHKSLTQAMFAPSEIASMRRLGAAMQDVAKKNPNTSWSAVGVGALMKDGFNAVLAAIGWNSTLARTAAGVAFKPVLGTYGSVQAAKATGGLSGARLPRQPGASYSGFGGAMGSQSQQ